MDKLSVKVLRYLDKQSEPVSKDTIAEKFGRQASESVRYLESAGFIKSGKAFMPHRNSNGQQAYFISNNKYEIASPGRDYLQSKPGKDFDRWLSRISILFSVLGGALLSKPLWAFLEWLRNYILQFFN